MDSTLNNLFALIDSAKEENLEMALQLSVNLADEWKWIHVLLQSKKRLPTGFRSWYEVYAEAVVFDQERVFIPVIADGKVDHQMYTMTEIHQGVALELHYILFGLDLPTLIGEITHLRSALHKMRGHVLPRSNVVSLADQIIGLMPR